MNNVECQKDNVTDENLEWLTIAERERMSLRHASGSALAEHQNVITTEDEVILNVFAS